jgi:protein TonB
VTTHRRTAAQELLHRLMVALGALALSTACFLVLPLMQAIARPPESDSLVRGVDTADLPPPPPPPEEPPPEEEEPEETPPELAEEAPPLDLSQLELALNPTLGDGFLQGDFAIRLEAFGARAAGDGDAMDALFSIADLDQEPRVVHQPSPTFSAETRRKAPGTVHVLFVVDQSGRVQDPVVQTSSDPVFEKPALAAVKQWKFEPGKRNGQPVRFRMRVPITFPKG